MRDTTRTAIVGLASIGRARRRSGLVLLTIMAAGLTTAGCAATRGPATDGSGNGGAAAAALATQTSPLPAASPAMLVSCAPGQQAEVRQVARDGVLVPLVTCLDVEPVGAGRTLARRAPVSAEPAGHMVGEDDRVVYVPRSRVRTQPAVYRSVDDMPVERRALARRAGRSWQKSAVIIGSAAGIGAGIGGAVGGGKGALIGAAIGGGSATIWDQATRR